MGKDIPEKYINKIKALTYGKEAASLGVAEIANKVGVVYDNGKIVSRDIDRAIKYYKIAASYGNTFAYNNLGLCYYNGDGVEQNYKKAAELFSKAAKQGHSDAQNYLGLCYYSGYGVEQNYNVALHWFELAASNGHEIAKENADEARKRIRESSRLLSDSDLQELKKNDENMRNKSQKIFQELHDELSSIKDELRSEGFFDILR